MCINVDFSFFPLFLGEFLAVQASEDDQRSLCFERINGVRIIHKSFTFWFPTVIVRLDGSIEL